MITSRQQRILIERCVMTLVSCTKRAILLGLKKPDRIALYLNFGQLLDTEQFCKFVAVQQIANIEITKFRITRANFVKSHFVD